MVTWDWRREALFSNWPLALPRSSDTMVSSESLINVRVLELVMWGWPFNALVVFSGRGKGPQSQKDNLRRGGVKAWRVARSHRRRNVSKSRLLSLTASRRYLLLWLLFTYASHSYTDLQNDLALNKEVQCNLILFRLNGSIRSGKFWQYRGSRILTISWTQGINS